LRVAGARQRHANKMALCSRQAAPYTAAPQVQKCRVHCGSAGACAMYHVAASPCQRARAGRMDAAARASARLEAICAAAYAANAPLHGSSSNALLPARATLSLRHACKSGAAVLLRRRLLRRQPRQPCHQRAVRPSTVLPTATTACVRHTTTSNVYFASSSACGGARRGRAIPVERHEGRVFAAAAGSPRRGMAPRAEARLEACLTQPRRIVCAEQSLQPVTPQRKEPRVRKRSSNRRRCKRGGKSVVLLPASTSQPARC